MKNISVIWYFAAAVATVVVWIRTAKTVSSLKKLLLRTGVISLGFTSVPIMSLDGGAIIPIGIYFLSGGDWLVASWRALIVIGIVWALLVAICVTAAQLWLHFGDRRWWNRQVLLTILVAVPCTILGVIILRRSVLHSSSDVYLSWLFLLPNTLGSLFLGPKTLLFVFDPKISGWCTFSFALQFLYYFVIVASLFTRGPKIDRRAR